MDFSETVVVFDLKLATDDQSDKKFLLTSKLCPLGAVCPLPRGYIYVLNHEKTSKRFLWNLQQMGKVIRSFCWHQSFVPWGLSIPAPGLYTCIKSWKKLFKIRLQRHFFETCNKWMKWQDISVEIKLCPLGAVCPCPGAIYMYRIMKKKKCIKSDFKEIFLKLAINDPSDKMFLLTSKFHPEGVVRPCPGAIYMYKIMKKKVDEILFKLATNDHSERP